MLETLILLIYSYEPSGGSPSVSFCPACALQNDDVMGAHTHTEESSRLESGDIAKCNNGSWEVGMREGDGGGVVGAVSFNLNGRVGVCSLGVCVSVPFTLVDSFTHQYQHALTSPLMPCGTEIRKQSVHRNTGPKDNQ